MVEHEHYIQIQTHAQKEARNIDTELEIGFATEVCIFCVFGYKREINHGPG